MANNKCEVRKCQSNFLMAFFWTICRQIPESITFKMCAVVDISGNEWIFVISVNDFTYMSAIWLLDIRIVHMSIFGCDTMNVHTDGTKCASYYGAFQN